jgi:hypothetical protein
MNFSTASTRHLLLSALLIGGAALALPSPALAAAEAPEAAASGPFIFLLDGEALFGYSDIAGPAEGDFSTSEKWLASAAYKVNEKDRLIALYNGSFRKDNIFIRQDEGSQNSNQLLSHSLSAAFQKHFSETLIVKPVFFYDTVFVKETADEDLGDGLYDYEDLGGGFENTHLFGGEDGKTRKLTYGFNVFRREYPNYRTLEALSSREPLEDKEKDFVGYKADASWRAPWWFDTSARVGGTALLKDYTDKLTVDSNGIRENGERRDLYFEVEGSLFKELTESIGAGFMSGFKNNGSNLDFYDTRNTLTLTDDRYFDGYYDYHAYELRPSVTLKGPSFFPQADPSSAQVSWTFEKTFYPGRTAQNISGVLLGEDQEDRNAKTAVQLNVPLSAHWTWMIAGSYEKQVSNQKFENTFLYTYEAWSVLSGVRFEL